MGSPTQPGIVSGERLAWRSTETNEVGVNEFARWAKKAGTELMMAVNLGTGTPREAGELVEYASYVGNYYGTPRAYVEEQLSLGRDVILEIEIQGALKIKEHFPDSVLLFLSPPSAKELRRRLEGRGTESREVVESRMTRAREEAVGIEEYDYFVVNDEIHACAEQVHGIMQSEHAMAFRSQALIEKIRSGL